MAERRRVPVGDVARRWRAAAALAAAGCDTPRLDAELLLARGARASSARGSCSIARAVLSPTRSSASRSCSRAAPPASRSPTSSAARGSGGSTLAVDRRVLIPRPGDRAAGRGGAGAAAGRAGGRRRDGQRRGGAGAEGRAARSAWSRGIDVSRRTRWRSRAPTRRGWGSTSVRRRPTCSTARAYDAVLANLPVRRRRRGAGAGDRAVRAAGGAVRRRRRARRDPPAGRRAVRRASPLAVALEIGLDQADAVAALLAAAGFGSVERVRDLAGHERVVVGRR